ncbi:hypothetical protein KR009_012277 [Drosophila setifemur]|nr:hypothetical protein KR009_012277 [Drosophila setifemur]
MHLLRLVFLFTLWHLVLARPFSEVLEDDIRLIPEQLQFFEGHKPKHRVVKSMSQYYWKKKTLVYSYGFGLTQSDISRVESAMADISSQTCIRFRRTTNPLEHQVRIQRMESGCWSYVGYLGKTNQDLNLGMGCMSKRTIQHELLHALGFYHTQSDPNRDNYVRINPENIKPGHKKNFEKLRPEGVTNFGFGYDYESIMHYGPYYFSKNGNPTIIPLQKKAKIGEATRMSVKDISTLRKMYCSIKVI